jgi:hypothetical protein
MQPLPRHAVEGQPRVLVGAPLSRESRSDPLTPAQRLALTIAFLNHGYDVVDQAARTCLMVCARRIAGVQSNSAKTQGEVTSHHPGAA